MYNSISHNVKKSINDINNIIDDFNDNLGETEGNIAPFGRLPQNLQIVLIDMVYNLGKTGFNWKAKKIRLKNGKTKTYGYPNFWIALAQRNIDCMVTQCIRNKTNPGFANRNKETQDLIRKTPENWTKNRLTSTKQLANITTIKNYYFTKHISLW